MQTMLSHVQKELTHMGITMRYKGYEQTLCAVSIALTDPDSLTLVSKLIYPDVAKRYGVSWHVVERNIRTVIGVIWDNNPQQLCVLAGHALSRKPTSSDFIAILANAAMQHQS